MGPLKPDSEKEQKRKLILEAATAVFLEKGYEAARVSEIVKRAGIAQGTFYLYFASKEEVFSGVADLFFQELLAEVALCLAGEDSILAKADRVIDQMARFMEREREKAMLMHSPVAASVLSRHEIAPRLAGQAETLVDLAASQIEAGIAKGEIRPCHPRYTAYIVVAAIHEVLETACLAFYPGGVDRIVSELKGFIRAALQPRSDS